MTTIIGIHGLANKPPAGQLAEWWDAAIRDGLLRKKNIYDPDYSFTSVYWADHMYGKYAGQQGTPPLSLQARRHEQSGLAAENL